MRLPYLPEPTKLLLYFILSSSFRWVQIFPSLNLVIRINTVSTLYDLNQTINDYCFPMWLLAKLLQWVAAF